MSILKLHVYYIFINLKRKMPCKRSKSKLFSTSSLNDEKLKWKLNSKVLCLYPSGGSNSYYEARIINIAKENGVTYYMVHYLVS